MKLFDSMKPRSGKASAQKREKELRIRLEKLMEIDDEEEFKAGLKAEFEIGPDHPRYKINLSVWRDAR